MVVNGIENTIETCKKAIITLASVDGKKEGIIFYDMRDGIMHGWGFTTNHFSTAMQLATQKNREVYYYKCTKSGRFTMEQIKY